MHITCETYAVKRKKFAYFAKKILEKFSKQIGCVCNRLSNEQFRSQKFQLVGH